LSPKISALFVITLLLVGTVSVSSNFALADDRYKDKKPKQTSCLDRFTGFDAKSIEDLLNCLKNAAGEAGSAGSLDGVKAAIMAAIKLVVIESDTRKTADTNLQDQINHIRLVQFPQRCPPGQEMVGIDIQGKIICEISTAQSQTSVIVTLSQTSIQVDPHVGGPAVPLTGAAIGLSPNTSVSIGDGLGNVFLAGTSDSKGIFSWPMSIPAGIPAGTIFIHATDANGRTGAAPLTITLPPLPASVTLTPAQGPIETDVLITATGLTPSDTITVSVVGIPVTSGPSDSTGGFSIHYIIPATLNSHPVPPGTYPVTVADQHGISTSAQFTVQ
jgi:hypothetical protein